MLFHLFWSNVCSALLPIKKLGFVFIKFQEFFLYNLFWFIVNKWGTNCFSGCIWNSHTIYVIIHVHRVMTLTSFCHFFLPPSTLTPLFPLYNPSFLILASIQPPIMYHHSLIREIICSLVYWDWVISLSMIFSTSLRLSNIPSYIYTTVSLSIHQLKASRLVPQSSYCELSNYEHWSCCFTVLCWF